MKTRWPARDVRQADRSWIPEFCGRCHSDSNFMRNYNPALPTDQLAKYRDSMHGQKLLKENDSKAAQCVSCHGVHGIRNAESNLSKVNAKRVPETCGSCHADAAYMKGYKMRDGSPLPTDQLERYTKSVHGKALLEKGDMGAPACNDCHGNHAAQPPEVASVSQVCRTCHITQATLFDGSKHKKAFTDNGWPECERCHTKHDIQKGSDAMLGDENTGLCSDCHSKYSKDNADCQKTAGHFRLTLASLAKELKEGAEVVEHIAMRGQDTDDLVTARGDLEEGLTKARTAIHSFDKSTFDEDGNKAHAAIAKTQKILAAADDEFSFRQKGVAVFIGIMFVLALGIYLKLRSIEAKQRAAAAEQPKA
jgi:predicted CXXCH cytochrome family protein